MEANVDEKTAVNGGVSNGKAATNVAAAEKRKRISQSDIPTFSVVQALRVAASIKEHYASSPTPPLDVAHALDISPTSSGFRSICGSAIAYGFTEGGYNATHISIADLGRRTLNAANDQEYTQCLREAALRPRVLREFLEKYEGNKFPRPDIAANVLIQLGVPREGADRAVNLIFETSKTLGFVRDIKGSFYVNVKAVYDVSGSGSSVGADGTTSDDKPKSDNGEAVPFGGGDGVRAEPESGDSNRQPQSQPATISGDQIFVSSSADASFAATLERILVFGSMKAVNASVRGTGAGSNIGIMRQCFAAIIDVSYAEGPDGITASPDTLIEVGAAIALFGDKVILLCSTNTQLPSSVQHLTRLDYDGQNIDAIRLIEVLSKLRQ